MTQPFPFELVSPEKLVFSGEVTSVQIPGVEGDFEVLYAHAPVMASLRPGVLTVKAEGTERRFFVNGGFADVNPQGLTVLATEALQPADLTAERIAKETAQAEAAIKEAASDISVFKAQQKLAALRELKAA